MNLIPNLSTFKVEKLSTKKGQTFLIDFLAPLISGSCNLTSNLFQSYEDVVPEYYSMEQYAEQLDFQLLNSDLFVKFSLEISGTLCYGWEKADYATKLRLQNLVGISCWHDV